MEKEVKEFHLSRIAFLIISNNIYFLENSEMSHGEWAEKLGISKVQFLKLVRGYVKDSSIYFYMGENFETNKFVEETAKNFANQIVQKFSILYPQIYCGVKIKRIGDIWKPIKKLKFGE